MKPTHDEILATIAMLRALRARRDRGFPCYLTTDPAWLVDQAINRRAGWLDDPSTGRGSCEPRGSWRKCWRGDPLFAAYPRRARSDEQRHLYQLAARINTPRLIVRVTELGGEWKKYLLRKLPERFTGMEED